MRRAALNHGLAGSLAGLLCFAVGLAGCGRDFNLPDAPEDLGPTELGDLAGFYRMTVPETVFIGETSLSEARSMSTAIPVSGTGIIQHLALPPALIESAGGDPLVAGLVPPGGLDLSNGLDISDGGTTYAFGFVNDEKIAGGKVLSADASVHGSFTLEPLPGAGLALATIDSCPGLPAFDDARPLYLERSCRFAPSRSGVYAGCNAGCNEACDPAEGPPTHFVAAGFTPIEGQPFDFVVATSFWTEAQVIPWVPNLAAGVYDRFQGQGVSLSVDVDQSKPRPGRFGLREQGGFLELDFRLGAPVSVASQSAFEEPADTTDVASYELGTSCATNAHLRRAVGGLEEHCSPTVDPMSLVIFAVMNGNALGVSVGVMGQGLLPAQLIPYSTITLLRFMGVRPEGNPPLNPLAPPLIPIEQFLQVEARAAPSGTFLTRTALCPGGTACFLGASGPNGVEVRAMVRLSGTWSICPGWPEEPGCEESARQDVLLDVPLVQALPFCVPRPTP